MASCRVEHQGRDDLSEVKAGERIVACMKNYEKKAVPSRFYSLMCFGEGYEIGQVKWALWIME